MWCSNAGEKICTFNDIVTKYPQICLSPHEYSWEDLYFDKFSYVIDISDHNISTEYAKTKEKSPDLFLSLAHTKWLLGFQ